MKYYSWLEHTIKIMPKQRNELYFNGTLPNVFYIQNVSDNPILISISFIPNLRKYDKKLNGHSNDIIGRPASVNRLYFYNPYDEEVELVIFSNREDFSMDMLKNNGIELENDGIIKGIQKDVLFNIVGSVHNRELFTEMLSGELNYESEIVSNISEIFYITNDSENECIIELYLAEGSSIFTLKSYETIEHLKILSKGFKVTGENINIRYCLLN